MACTQITLPNGEKFTAFSWEKTDKADALRADAGLKASSRAKEIA